MNAKINKLNAKKRIMLTRLGKAGVGTAAFAALGASGWIRPIVGQVVLPAHAQTTTESCAGLQVVAVPEPCSNGMPVTVFISSADGLPVQITSVPTIKATPTPTPKNIRNWDGVDGGAVPAIVTDVDEYNLITRGFVLDEPNLGCKIPATGAPNDPNVPLTSLELTIEYMCPSSGLAETVVIDILPDIKDGPG